MLSSGAGHSSEMNWGPLSVLKENGKPNLANMGASASMSLALVVDFIKATCRNQL